MSAAENKAVFLSYASQDAEAARRICEALRSGGVEVWFDADGGLEHGDEWDAKIRKQIKDCVLFIAIISANTQAREEGYFRLEWDLAAERARTIASGVPFLLPMVIDDTREGDALVPDRFRTVQWTRLANGEVRPEVRARLLKLWSHRTGALAAKSGSAPRAPFVPDAPVGANPPRRIAFLAAGLAALLVAGVVGWKFLRSETSASSPSAAATSKAASEADRLLARAAATFDRLNYTREDLAAADLLARKATDLAPDSADAWAMRAFVEAAYVWRLWDRSDRRRQDVESLANRALALDPKQVRAMVALAELHQAQRAFAQAEIVARRAIALQPDDPHLFRVLADALTGQERETEAIALLRETARRFPRDVLTHYDLGSYFARSGDFAAALQSFDAALAITPFPGAQLNKARMLVALRGDLAGARRVMDEIAPSDRTELRVVAVGMWLGLLERRLDRVQAAAALTAQTYLERGPKAGYLALALQLDGKEALAQQQWRAAEAVARQRWQERSNDIWAAAQLAIALARQGRSAEAAQEIGLCEATVLERPAAFSSPTVLVAVYHAALGEAAKAVSFLRAAGARFETSAHVLALDPHWDKIRETAEFRALIAERSAESAGETKASSPSLQGASTISGALVDTTALAVLPFENLSADPGSAEFTDGMHDEVLMAVGKVSGLKVIGRTSVLKYADARKRELRAVGADLGVSSVIEGTVRRMGDRVRITVSMVNVADGRQLWGDSFHGELTDAFAIQSSIAERVAGALKITLTAGERVELARQPTTNAEAYALYLRAMAGWRQLGVPARAKREQMEELIALCEKSVAADPRFVRAQTQLAILHAMLFWFGDFDPTPERAARAEAAAARVRELAPDSPEARLVMAHIAYRCRHDWEAALGHYRAAAAMLPNDLGPWTGMANSLRRLGRWEEAIAAWRRVLSVDPDSLNDAQSLVESLISMRRYEEALATVESLLRRMPGSPTLQAFRAQVRFALGSPLDVYVRELEPVIPKLEGYSRLPSFHALLHAKRFAEAEAMLARSGATFAGPGGVVASPVPHNLAFLRHLQGDRDGAKALARETRPLLDREGSRRQRAILAAELAVCHALAGETELSEAAAQRSRVLMQAVPDAVVEAETRFLWAKAALIRGDKRTALDELKVAVSGPFPPDFTVADLRHDLLWAPLRGAPDFEQALARAKPL